MYLARQAIPVSRVRDIAEIVESKSSGTSRTITTKSEPVPSADVGSPLSVPGPPRT